MTSLRMQVGTHDSISIKGKLQLYKRTDFHLSQRKRGEKGKSSGMSNHTLSECPSTPLKPKPLQVIISLIATYHVFILYYYIRHSQSSYEILLTINFILAVETHV